MCLISTSQTKILIAGAGDIGFHLAKLLSFEQKNIVLIDTNSEVLEYAQFDIDFPVIREDFGSVSVLEAAVSDEADLFLAVTTSEKTNLVSAILAKKMGL